MLSRSGECGSGLGDAPPAYTVVGMIAAAALGLPLEPVTFQLGDSTLPLAPVEGGSSHVATVGSAVEGACEKLQRKFWHMARQMTDSAFTKTRFADVGLSMARCALPANRPCKSHWWL